jgi:Ca-activated chloride channel homolog
MKMRKLILATCAFALVSGPIPSVSKVEARKPMPRDPLCQINGHGSDYLPQAQPAYLPPPPPNVLPPPQPPVLSPTIPSPAQQTATPQSSQNGVVVVSEVYQQQPSYKSKSIKRNSDDVSEESKDIGALPVPEPRRYVQPQPENRERYEGEDVAGIQRVINAPVSTFAVDVDTGAYANVRRFLKDGEMPPAAAVRSEEMVNYFRYDYPLPKDKSQPFSITTDMATTPWNPQSKLLRIGLRGYDLDYNERPAANLVFLVDVSGSMGSEDKLPLVQTALSKLADNIRPQDRVSIVVYAGAAGLKLSPCNNPDIIKKALDQLESGGSTAGGEGLKLAYATAQKNYIPNGVNRIMLATDGDFNVGISDKDELKKYVEKQREDGVTLTTLGFGQGNYNEALMEQIANVGNGNYAYIDSEIEAGKVLNDEMSSTLFTIAKDVKIQIEFNPAYVNEYRLIGYENRLLAEEDFDNDKIDAGDIGASHQVTALYEIMPTGARGWLPDRRFDGNKAEGEGSKNGEMAFVKLRYKLPNKSPASESSMRLQAASETSMLIEKPLMSKMMFSAGPPKGDMAFAISVAAFAQKLRGDKYLGDFGYDQISALAGKPKNLWQEEFIRMTAIAKSKS